VQRATRSMIEQICRSVQRLNPIQRLEMRLKKERAQDVIDGTYATFHFSVLRRCVRARKSKDNAFGLEEGSKSAIVKFCAIITLHQLNR
jgi:hypothetical protein